MSVNITCKNKVILHIKNVLFDRLYQNIIEILNKHNLKIPNNIEVMIHEMDQDSFGFGLIDVDIADYIKTKSDLLLFADLVKQAAEKESEYSFSEPARAILFKFHDELIKYGEELEN